MDIKDKEFMDSPVCFSTSETDISVSCDNHTSPDAPKQALIKILIAGGFLGFISAFVFTPSSDDYSEATAIPEPETELAEASDTSDVPDTSSLTVIPSQPAEENISFAAKTLAALTSSAPIEPDESKLEEGSLQTETRTITLNPSDSEHGKEKEYKLKSGESLIALLKRAGTSGTDANKASLAINDIYDVRKLRPGQTVSLIKGENLYSVTLTNKDGDKFSAVRDDSGNYIPTTKEAKIEIRKSTVAGVIEVSFSESAEKMGIPKSVSNQISQAFNDKINFKRDIKDGDTFEAVFEQRFNDEGMDMGGSKLLFASIRTGGKTYNRYYYKNRKGVWDYYDENGNGVKKAMNVWPVGKRRISSRFGTRRHPILLYTTTHWGVDYATKIGTPVGAAADGEITFIGNRGGYGKYVQMRHTNGYSTAYAHLNSYNRALKVGDFVKQGQIIAFSGNTGRSTGPHLHFEVIKNGKKVNPLGKGRFMLSNKLKGKELQRFTVECKKVNSNYNVADNKNDSIKTR